MLLKSAIRIRKSAIRIRYPQSAEISRIRNPWKISFFLNGFLKESESGPEIRRIAIPLIIIQWFLFVSALLTHYYQPWHKITDFLVAKLLYKY